MWFRFLFFFSFSPSIIFFFLFPFLVVEAALAWHGILYDNMARMVGQTSLIQLACDSRGGTDLLL